VPLRRCWAPCWKRRLRKRPMRPRPGVRSVRTNSAAPSKGHWTTLQTRLGPIRVQRARGQCRRGRKGRFAADTLWGWPEEGPPSPSVQERAAWTVSKMPATEAEQVVERLAGIKISAATPGRPARPQGQRAQEQREALDQKNEHPRRSDSTQTPIGNSNCRWDR
jgi:hypothetical protein